MKRARNTNRMGLANSIAIKKVTQKLAPQEAYLLQRAGAYAPVYCITNVHCLYATDRVILVELRDQELWIDKSILDAESCVRKSGDYGTLVITNLSSNIAEILNRLFPFFALY